MHTAVYYIIILLQPTEDGTSTTQWAGDYDPDYASWLPPSGMYVTMYDTQLL